jgi:hypothetical protein
MDEVAGATTLPIVMLGGDPGADWNATFNLWEASMQQPNVRGLVAGRAMLYPAEGSVEEAVARGVQMVHGTVAS